MKCRDHAGTSGVRQTRILTKAFASTCALLLLSGVLPSPAGTAASPPVVDVPAILKQAKDYQLRFRDGDLEVVNDNVTLLENATAAEAGNAGRVAQSIE